MQNQQNELCKEHDLEFHSENHREMLWQCRKCPFFEFVYADTYGG